MSINEYTFRIAREADRAAIVDFMNAQWDVRHPLVNLPDFFDFYYKAPDGRLNFALAEQGGRLCALAGFVPASIKIKPDVWVSLWVADKRAKGVGIELMNELPGLTGCGTLSCNNIRPETRIFYEFLGYKTGRMRHFYRLAERSTYTLARINHKEILDYDPAGSNDLILYPTIEELHASGFIPPEHANPYKDLWYIRRRYYEYPGHQYLVYGVACPGAPGIQGLLVARVADADGVRVLRIVDFIGRDWLLQGCGSAIDSLLRQTGAEYADLYCAGLSPQLMVALGFSERVEGDGNIIPNYLSPPLYENTEYYYFTNNTNGFRMFKADGDQDRPNLPVPD